MMQFYFLSVVMNVLAGLVLLNLKGHSADEFNSEADTNQKQKLLKDVTEKLKVMEFLQNKTLILIVGILSLIVGVIKLFAVGESPIIVGDLFPALGGIAAGFALLLNCYLDKSSGQINLPQIIQTIFVEKTYLIGLCCLVISVLHFIMPRVIFF